MRFYRTLLYLICACSITFNQGIIDTISINGSDLISQNEKIKEHLLRSAAIIKSQLLRDYAIHYLIPFTKAEHLKPCREVFNEEKNFQEALTCTNATVFHKDNLTEVEVPECYVVSSDSPDVMESEDGSFNYISTSILLMQRILGFYEEETKTLYITETYDMEKVYRHELQHYFLHLKEGDGNGRHDHEIWQLCEPPYYEPSDEAIAHAHKKKEFKKTH